jgi:quinol monooxygenase YgiN
MKPLFLFLAAVSVVFSGWSLGAAEPAGVFRHVVLFKFKPDATPEQIRRVEEEFRKLPAAIDVIQDFEWGTSRTVEADLAQGYTHGFLLTFRDRAGLEAYLPHPAHTAFVDLVKPLLEEVHVFDYVAGK